MEGGGKMARLIYVADDEKKICELIKIFLINAGYAVETFATGDELYQRFLEKPADLVVLDIMMPGTDGLNICKNLRERWSIPIIIVSAKGSETDRVTGITLGGDDYLVKPFSPLELIARINGIFRRLDRLAAANENTTKLSYQDIVVYLDTRQVQVNGWFIDVTPTEYNFFVYMIENQEKAVSREQLLKEVWNAEVEVGLRVTDDLVKRLRKKLIAANSRSKIETIWGYGFKLTKGGL